eukprot:g8789.t1
MNQAHHGIVLGAAGRDARPIEVAMPGMPHRRMAPKPPDVLRLGGEPTAPLHTGEVVPRLDRCRMAQEGVSDRYSKRACVAHTTGWSLGEHRRCKMCQQIFLLAVGLQGNLPVKNCSYSCTPGSRSASPIVHTCQFQCQQSARRAASVEPRHQQSRSFCCVRKEQNSCGQSVMSGLRRRL